VVATTGINWGAARLFEKKDKMNAQAEHLGLLFQSSSNRGVINSNILGKF
jgi:hypothetical protein